MRSITAALALLCALLGAACSTPSPEVLRPRAPLGPPGAEARSGDQNEPRLEPLPESPPAPTPVSELDRAADLSRRAAQQRNAGDIDAALALQTEALAIRERILGPNHPDVAATLNNLAALYAARDQYAAAEPLLVRALTIREQTLGADAPLTAQSMSNLALLYAAEGRYADAEPLHQRAVAVFEAGSEPAALATALENYAAMLADMGRGEEAERLDAKARALRATDVRKEQGVN